jgi:hypothetical protein
MFTRSLHTDNIIDRNYGSEKLFLSCITVIFLATDVHLIPVDFAKPGPHLIPVKGCLKLSEPG